MMTIRQAVELLLAIDDQDRLIHDKVADAIRKISDGNQVKAITWDDERKAELASLFENGYSVTEAAKHFGIVRQALWRAIKLHNLTAPTGRKSRKNYRHRSPGRIAA